MFATQSNTIKGAFEVLAGEDLTGQEGKIVELTHDTGVAEVQLPSDVADTNLYLLVKGGADATLVTVMPLTSDQQIRVRLNGTCNPGDELCLATIDGTDDGKVETLPGVADDYFVFLVAEEAGVDEQLVLCRPISNSRVVTVP